jgi:hypothetical protein
VARKDPTPPDDLPPTEAARARHRDAKRVTKMVVDNAGVKRIAPALAARAKRKPAKR